MRPHDAAEVWQHQDGSWSVRCFCQATFTRGSKDDALAAHFGHFGVEKARAALRKEGDGS